MSSFRKRLGRFFFECESGQWVAILRIGLGFQILFYSLSLQSDWGYLFGGAESGLNGRALAEGLLSRQSSLVPRLGWLIRAGGSVGLGSSTVLTIVWCVLLLAGLFLMLGVFSRPAAVAAWFLHLSAAKSGSLVAYGVDSFMTIGLFYLTLSPLPGPFSLAGSGHQRADANRELSCFFRRLLQIHLCLVYFFGGLAKCLGGGWWDGSNLWRALIRPPFDVIDAAALVRWKSLFPVAGILIWVLELGYVGLIWPDKTRKIWLLAICLMHAGIGLTMGMYLFSFVMIILNVAAFGPSWTMARLRSEAPAPLQA
jgi:hypothetical protein